MGSRGLIRSIDIFGVTKPLDRIFEDIIGAITSYFHIIAIETVIRGAQRNRERYINAGVDVLEERKEEMINVIDKSIEKAKKSEYGKLAEELEGRKEVVDFITEVMKTEDVTNVATDIFIDVLKTVRTRMK